ncbi:hypothetical protein GCM10023080_040370 [Streptomyces pseudoechinosporeus]
MSWTVPGTRAARRAHPELVYGVPVAIVRAAVFTAPDTGLSVDAALVAARRRLAAARPSSSRATAPAAHSSASRWA